MTNVLIRRNAPNDSCRNLTALMSRYTKTSFIITPHYICAHRNPDNVHNAAFLRYSADVHILVVLRLLVCSVPNHPSRHTRVLTRCAESSVAVCRSVPKHPVAKHPCAETSVCRNCFWPKHPGPVDDDVVNLFTGAGDIPPNGVLLKRTALCSFCKFLEAMNVGLVE